MADVILDAATAADQAAALLSRAAEASKCAPCGCAHGCVVALTDDQARLPQEVLGSTARLRTSLVAERYECLGCAPCWPAEALGLLADAGMTDAGASCPTDVPNERPGWPALPGAYTVLRWAAPVGVCTLNDADLAERVAATANPHIAIVGTLATENLGIERLVRNVLTNPNLRFVVLAGPDTRQAVGHLPGASLLALAARGVDERGRIIGASGRRAVLRNVTSAEIEAFRTTVEVIARRPGHDRDRCRRARRRGSQPRPHRAARRPRAACRRRRATSRHA